MNFYQVLSNLHGYVAILACTLLVFVTIMTAVYFFTKKDMPYLYRRLGLYMLISFHIQMLIGVIMLFMNSSLIQNFMQYKIQGKVSLMEHIPTNFTVVLLVTVFYSISKKKQRVNLVMLLLLVISFILLGRTFVLLHACLMSN